MGVGVAAVRGCRGMGCSGAGGGRKSGGTTGRVRYAWRGRCWVARVGAGLPNEEIPRLWKHTEAS